MAAGMAFTELETALSAIGESLDYPPTADLAVAVSRRIAQEPRRRVVFRLRSLRLPVLRPPAVFRPAWQVALAAFLAAVVAFSGAFAASPAVREAVERWFGLRGVKIVQSPPPVAPSVHRLGEGLDLGLGTTLAEAQQHLGERILLPAGLGKPDEVWVRDLTVGGAEVFLVYRPRPGLPVTSQTGVGLLLSEFTGDLYRPGIEKFAPDARLEPVVVNGGRGFWVQGGHSIGYLDGNGNVVLDDLRLAGNVLVWEQGELTLRIESALSEGEVLQLARTIR
jgi:hypothetical protein